MLRAVCFDLDGTLFDDRQYVEAGLRSAAEKLEAIAGVDLTEAFLEAYFEEGIREGTFDHVLAERGLPERLVPELVEAYHDNDAALEPYPGAVDALEALEDAYDLALVTGGRNGRDKLDRLGLDDYFETVLVTSGRPYSKRDPDPFEAVCEDLGVPADATAYVGDRPDLDFPQANALGMYTIRVEAGRYADADATGEARPDVTIPTVRDLPELLSDLG